MEPCRYGSHFLNNHVLCLKKCSALTPEKTTYIIMVIILVIVMIIFMVIIIMVISMVIDMIIIIVILMPVPTGHRIPSVRTYAGRCCQSKLNTMAAPPVIQSW